MDFKQLESFITIAKFKSYSKASRELFLTQPALSNHINNLEKELMTQLFDRYGKTIELTTAGAIFLDYAQNLVKTRDSAVFDINNLIGQFEGLIEIPYSTVPGEKIIPDLVSDFILSFPGVKFKLYHMDSGDVIDSIQEKKYSIGFSGMKPNNEFESYSIYKDDMVFIGPKNKPLSSEKIDILSITNLPLIVREQGSGSGSIIDNALKKYNLRSHNLNVVAVIENFHLIIKMVKKSVGYAFIPRSFAEEFVNKDEIDVYEVTDINSSRDFYFINHKKSVLSPLEAQFKHYVLKKYK